MLGRGIRAANRAGEYDLPGSSLVDELANESLRQFQWGEEISIEHTSEQLHRDFSDGTAFSDCRIIYQRINLPIQCVLDIVGMQEIKFLNLKVLQAKRLDFPAKCSRLGPDLHPRNHIMTLLCQPDRG